MKKSLLLVLALITILAVSFVSAADIPVDGNDVTLEINGHKVRSENENIRLSLDRDSVIDLDVFFTGLANADDVELRAWIAGYEHNKIDRIEAISALFDIKENVEDHQSLTLKLPELMKPGVYTLRVLFEDKNSNNAPLRYTLEIDTPKNSLDIRDVIFTPGNSVKAGTSFITNVRLKNIGHEVQDNVKVTVAIPELGRLDALYIDEIEPEEYVTSEGLVINVPLCGAEDKDYKVVVVVDYNDYQQEVEEFLIHVTENEACDADYSFGAKSGFDLTALRTSAKVTSAGKTTFPLVISNPSDESKSVYVSVVGADDLTVDVSPSQLVTVSPLSQQRVDLEVAADGAAEGDHTFTVKVADGNTEKTLSFTANVAKAKVQTSGNNWILVSVVIVAVLLIIIIIIVLFNKMSSDDDDEDELY